MDPGDADKNTIRDFRRFRFYVEVEADPDAVIEQVPTGSAAASLQSEIKTNLESLDGIRSVSVDPAP